MLTIQCPLEAVRCEGSAGSLCAKCQGFLDWHQPEPSRPARLLGICTECSAWFLSDDRMSILYEIPEAWEVPHVGG